MVCHSLLKYTTFCHSPLQWTTFCPASDPCTSWQIDGEKVETVTDFILGDSKITEDSDHSHEIKRHLLFGRKAMTNLDSVLKSRDITLSTKIFIVKAMVFLVVMYGCESEVTQSCPTLSNPVYCSLPGSYIHGILQARIPEWVSISFSRGSSWSRDRIPDSRIAGRRFILWATREVLYGCENWII